MVSIIGYDVASAISDPDSIFFRCTLRPVNETKGRYNRYSEDIDVDLFFFSAFEDFRLHSSGTMVTNGIRKLFEPSESPAGTCPDSIRWQDSRPLGSGAGATLSVLSSWQRHLYHSKQVRCSTEPGLRIRVPVCRRRKPGIAQWQPCVLDQHLAVELWQAPASCWWNFDRRNRKDPQTLQV
jgi:hypothetical protein